MKTLLKLYENKLNDLDEMGKVLERHKLPKLTKEKIPWIVLYLLKIWIKNFPKKKTPGPDDFPSKFHSLFKKERIVQWKLF